MIPVNYFINTLYYKLIDFAVLHQPCIPKDKSHLMVIYNSFYTLLIWFANILLRIFCDYTSV